MKSFIYEQVGGDWANLLVLSFMRMVVVSTFSLSCLSLDSWAKFVVEG